MRTFRFLTFTATSLMALSSFFLGASCDQTGTTTTFTGTVTEAGTGIPLEGVSVTVMPFNLGEETGPDGKYAIEMPRTTENVYLAFSVPGYRSWESGLMPLAPKKKNQYVIDVQLEPRIAKAALSTLNVDFGAQQESVAVTLSNPGSDTLRWNFLELYFPSWLQADPSGGELEMNASRTIRFLCDRTGLPIGEEHADVQLVGGQAPLTVHVSVLVEGAALTVTGTSFDFGEEETQGTTLLANSGNIPLDWHLEDDLPLWLSWEPDQGSVAGGEEQQILITADRSNIDYGNHTFNTRLLSNGGEADYTFSLSRTRDLIQVSANALDFGTGATERTLTVSRLSGVHDIAFTVACDDPNLTLSHTQGTVTKEKPSHQIRVTLDRENIPAGATESALRVVAQETAQEFSVRVNYATAAVPAEVTTDGFELDDSWRLRFRGTLVSNGGGSVVEHGHCWGTTPEPVLENNEFSALGPFEEGRSYVTYPDQLPQPGTRWYYRAYATNEMGTSYGNTLVLDYAPPALNDPVVSFDNFLATLRFRENNALGIPFTEHGFVWNTTGTVPLFDSDNVVRLGNKGSGTSFFHNMANPSRGNRYTMRSFAVNEYGRSFSDTVSLFLAVQPPVVETSDAGSISYYGAQLQGTIGTLGSEKIIDHGHCWGVSSSPGIDDPRTRLGEALNTGSFTSVATGLLINTTYYYRAYIQTASGVYYGSVREFTTLKDNSVAVQEGLQMYITTDNTPKAYEWTGRVPDLTVSSGVTYNTGNKPAGTHASVSFNGTSAYLLSRNFNPLSGSDNGTINFWLRFRDRLNKSLVYPFFGSVSEGGFYVEIRHNGTDWVLTLCMGPGQQTYVVTLPSLGGIDISSMLGTSWHMMSIVSNGISMTVYLDGTALYTESLQMSFGEQDDFVIGANALNGTTLNTFLPADMACLRFYNRVVTASEIARIYEAGQ
ncbi:MAG: hypothetical protein PHS38_05035 [Bacteroidales bacterium]|jgi:hypothetical protein|nr:hypothetical protein [Bacteroidales bacterium]